MSRRHCSCKAARKCITNVCVTPTPRRPYGKYSGWLSDQQRRWRNGSLLRSEGFDTFEARFGPEAFTLHHRFYLHRDGAGAVWLAAEDGCEGRGLSAAHFHSFTFSLSAVQPFTFDCPLLHFQSFTFGRLLFHFQYFTFDRSLSFWRARNSAQPDPSNSDVNCFIQVRR